jgi:IS1 family transposase
MAKILKTNLKTIARKLNFLSSLCEKETAKYVESLRLAEIQFDEMESFEHTKLKPLSIPLIVEKHSRKILGIKVCEMPAKGLIAKRSREKYGRRRDHRTKAIKEIFNDIKLLPDALIESDQNPRYQQLVNKYFPRGIYKQYKGRRGCVTGQGEIKEGGMDPMFSLNHTCAMIRDSVKRLARRTWCTTKRKEMLQMHLNIYVHYHNFHLTK